MALSSHGPRALLLLEGRGLVNRDIIFVPRDEHNSGTVLGSTSSMDLWLTSSSEDLEFYRADT